MIEEYNFRSYIGDELYLSTNGRTLPFSYSDREEHTKPQVLLSGDEVVKDVFEKCGLVLK